MSNSLSELLEDVDAGLIWAGADGVVRRINALGAKLTGLKEGKVMFDPDLKNAVATVVKNRGSMELKAIGMPPAPGQSPTRLSCRVIPGLVKDDAFVFVRQAEVIAPASVADHLLLALNDDVHAPLKETLARLKHSNAQWPLMVECTRKLFTSLDLLVELATLWQGPAPSGADNITLWPLVQMAWMMQQNSPEARACPASMPPPSSVEVVTLYGDTDSLSRAIRLCIDSALRNQPPAQPWNIHQEVHGQRVLIHFTGAPIFPRPKPAPGVKLTEPSRRQALELFGHQLVEKIVQAHGGQLLEDAAEQRFSVALPTNQPHRASAGVMDIAQAQQYARDLAALMSRARLHSARDAAAKAEANAAQQAAAAHEQQAQQRLAAEAAVRAAPPLPEAKPINNSDDDAVLF